MLLLLQPNCHTFWLFKTVFQRFRFCLWPFLGVTENVDRGKVIDNKGRKGYTTFHFSTRMSCKKGGIGFPAAAPGAFKLFWDYGTETAMKRGVGVTDGTDTIHHKHHGSMNNSNVYFYYFFQVVKMR